MRTPSNESPARSSRFVDLTNATMPDRLKAIALIFAVVASSCVGLLLAGGIGELAVRYRETHRSTVPGTMPLMFYRRNSVGFGLVRNSVNFGWYRINAAGFRGPDVPLEKKPGVIRIVALGGSTTFDPRVHGDANAWPRRLEFWLHRLAPDRPVEVINAGVPGYRVYQDIAHLRMDVAQYHPDVILEFQGGMDLIAILQDAFSVRPTVTTDTPDEVETYTPWGYWLSRHSLLYSKVQERLEITKAQRRGRRAGAMTQDSTAVSMRMREGVAAFSRDLAAFTVIGRMLGSNVILIQPSHVSGYPSNVDTSAAVIDEWRHAVPFAPMSSILRGYTLVGQAMDSVGRWYGAQVVPASALQIVGRQYFDEEPIHFNDAGADSMARHLAQWLIDSGQLNEPSAANNSLGSVGARSIDSSVAPRRSEMPANR